MNHMQRWSISRLLACSRVRAYALALATVLAASCIGLPSGAVGATSSVTVSLTVPSTISLTNQCTAPVGTQLGALMPGAAATTATNANVCHYSFVSNNDSGMIRMSQRDGSGTAMGQSSGAFQLSGQEDFLMLTAAASSPSVMFTAGREGMIRRTINGGTSWTDWNNVNTTWDWYYGITPSRTDATTWFAVAADHNVTRINSATTVPTFTNIGTTLPGWPMGTAIMGVVVVRR